MHLEMSSAKWQPSCLSLNQLNSNQSHDTEILAFLPIVLTTLRTLCVLCSLQPANERRCYKVTSSLIGWAQTLYLQFSHQVGPNWTAVDNDHNYIINSLAPGKSEWNFRSLIFQIISVIDGWVTSWELTLRWMSLDLTDDKLTLVQVMAWCLMAPSHYLSQCWPRSLSPYGVTRPQWVNWYLSQK